MALQIRRGLNSERITKVLQNGEIAWTTDTKKLYVGDGVTTGGTNILASAQGVGLSWNPITEQLDLTTNTLFINSSNVTETTNLFHTAQRAQDAAAALFTNAALDHVGISFVYDSVNHKLTATVTQENIEDKVGAVLTAGNTTNTGIIFTYDATADTNNRVNAAIDLEYLQDKVAELFSNGVHTSITYTYDDVNNRINSAVSSLSGNLNLNTNNITGTGNITITSTSNYAPTITVTGIGSGQNSSASIQLRNSRTGVTPLELNDILGNLGLSAYNGTDYIKGTVFFGQMASNVSAGSFAVDSGIYTLNSDGNYREFFFRNTGVFEALGIKLVPVPTVGIATITPSQGGIAYDSTLNRLKIYTGSAYEPVVTQISVPPTSSSPGVPGQIAANSTHIYVCIANNSWVRASAASW